MDRYVTGGMIRGLREKRKMTQEELAAKLFVSGKAVSKWETGQGLPDITLLEPLAAALGISVIELMSGENVRNLNRSANMLKTNFYVCPVCGNVIHSCGEAVISCCGITLPALQAEEPDAEHSLEISEAEDEFFVTAEHPMTREHYISFFAAVSDSGVELVKLYQEWNAEARLRRRGVRWIYSYCNRHGLFRTDVSKAVRHK